MSEAHCEKCGQAKWLPHVFKNLDAELEQVKKERDAALTKAQNYENDWMQSKHEFGAKLKEVNAQLAEAVKALEFYAAGNHNNPGSWVFRKKFMFDMISDEDLEEIGPEYDKGRRYVFGGKLARETLQKLGGEK